MNTKAKKYIRHKNRAGFTLIELIITVAILALTIYMSSALFDNAIRQSPKIEEMLANKSRLSSAMEDGVRQARGYSQYYKTTLSSGTETEPDGYKPPVLINIEGGGLKFKGLGDNINQAKGYVVSASLDSSNQPNIQINSSTESTMGKVLNTFVGIGRQQVRLGTIQYIQMNAIANYQIFSMDEGNTFNVQAEYLLNNKDKDILKTVRRSILISNTDSAKVEADNSRDKLANIYIPYVDGYSNISAYPILNQWAYTYLTTGDKQDKPVIQSKNNYYISEEMRSYNSDSKDYLNKIDKSYIATATSLNKNQYVGNVVLTLDNTDSKKRMVHYIGIPTINNLRGMYDPNLIISKSNQGDGKYYSLFDVENKGKTSYSALLSNAGANFKFSWANKDVRDFLNLANKQKEILTMPDGFLEQQKFKDSNNYDIVYPNNLKPYGNTIYYGMKDDTSSIKMESNSDFTVFIKYNTDNYYQKKNQLESDRIRPYVLAKCNYDAETGNLSFPTGQTEGSGFALYVNDNGEIRLNSGEVKVLPPLPPLPPATDPSAPPEPDLDSGPVPAGFTYNFTDNPISNGYNINQSNLYKDGSYHFDVLGYGKYGRKRDNRENFKILALIKSGNQLKLYALEQIWRNSQLETDCKLIDTIDNIPNSLIYFGTAMNNKLNTEGTAERPANVTQTELGYASINNVLEVADVLVYRGAWSDVKQIHRSMDYMYRKYLTEHERNKSGFDNYFISEY